MAINNWRYVTTGWYMDPNGNIIEETQYVPNQTRSPEHIMNQIDNILAWSKTPGQVRMEDNIYWTPVASSYASGYDRPFSTAETYALQSQWYANQWDNAMATVYWDLANSLWQYSQYANTTLWAYDNLLNYISWNESKLQAAAWKLYNELSDDISSQRNYVNRMFWPEGELTQEVNKYYDDLWNYLATDAGRQAAKIAAQWVHSGASLSSIRAQENEAYNQSFQRYIQAKEQQINAKQQIASNLINFMSTLRKEYWDTTNQYIIEMYKRANDLYNNVALSVAQDMESYNKLRLSASGWSGSWGGSNTLNDILKSLWLINKDWDSTDNADWIIKWQSDWTSKWDNINPDSSELGDWSRSAIENSNKTDINWTEVIPAIINLPAYWAGKFWNWIWNLVKWS